VDEHQAIAAAQKDPAQFSVLYEENFERVYAFVVRRVHNRTEAEDVTSEVFHSALRNLGKFEPRGVPFVAWLYRIAANEMADRAKRAGREEPLGDVEGPAAVDEVERRALLFRLVDTLPPAQRDVIVKRFAEQRTIAEIARLMGRSEGAIKQLQLRAIENLRSQVRGPHA
jgi:RNA polymerase sigma-70 factor (ECF subfamily)